MTQPRPVPEAGPRPHREGARALRPARAPARRLAPAPPAGPAPPPARRARPRSAPALRQPEPPPPSGQQRGERPAGRHGGPPGAGGEALAAGALVSGHPGPAAREGAGRWPKVSSQAERLRAGLAESCRAASPRPRARALRLSGQLAAGTRDPARDARLRRDPCPPSTGTRAGPLRAPHLGFPIGAPGVGRGSPAYLPLVRRPEPRVELAPHCPHPVFKEMPSSPHRDPGGAHLGHEGSEERA